MKSKILTIAGIILLGVAVFFGVRFFLDTYSPKNLKTEQLGPVPAVTAQAQAPDETVLDETQQAAPDETAEESEEVLAVDFEALQTINPDIYAWIDIPGTDISYPVVQSPDNDYRYLRTNSDGLYSAGGAIFSEATYNSTGFSDPVTILYGHHMNAGNIMFGHLQDYYSDPEFTDLDSPIMIYTPDGNYEYRVFAAIPYSREHILYHYDMSDPSVFQAFIETVMDARELGAFFNEEYVPQDPETDKVLILSTCLTGNNTRRFLVLATLSGSH